MRAVELSGKEGRWYHELKRQDVLIAGHPPVDGGGKTARMQSDPSELTVIHCKILWIALPASG